MVLLKHSGKRGCGFQWDYKGKKKVFATCPDCYKKVRINESKVKKKKS